MKKFIFPVLIIIFAAACSQSGTRTYGKGQEPSVEIAPENLVQVSSHTEQRAVVSFDAGKTDTEAISRAIIDAGYEVIGHNL